MEDLEKKNPTDVIHAAGATGQGDGPGKGRVDQVDGGEFGYRDAPCVKTW